jgi:hypothetical protein
VACRPREARIYSIITDRASTLITSYSGRRAITTVSANSRGQLENKYFGARDVSRRPTRVLLSPNSRPRGSTTVSDAL